MWFAKKLFHVYNFQMARAVWLYYMAKIMELLDTVFFVLRKKNSQVTFLHLYHHSLMPICSFIGVKYFAGKEICNFYTQFHFLELLGASAAELLLFGFFIVWDGQIIDFNLMFPQILKQRSSKQLKFHYLHQNNRNWQLCRISQSSQFPSSTLRLETPQILYNIKVFGSFYAFKFRNIIVRVNKI